MGEALDASAPMYAVVGDYIEVQCQINRTSTALWEYSWETPRNQSISGCPVHYVTSAQPADQGQYYCIVRDPVVRQYFAQYAINISLAMFSVRTSKELIVLSGKGKP